MKYFVTETERKKSKSTCYFEFQKGRSRAAIMEQRYM